MRNLKTVLAVLLTSITLVACDDDSHDPQLRAVHLSPDAPAVNISVNDAIPAALTGVEYRQASPFLSVDKGSTALSVLVPALADASALDAILDLKDDNKYTVIAANTVANGLPLTPIVVQDSIKDPDKRKAAITVVHGSQAAQVAASSGVDVYVTSPGGDLVNPVLEDVMFGDQSAELQLDAGDYQIRITPADTTTVVYDSGSIELVDGVEYIAIAADDTDSDSLVGLTILTDLPSTPFLNVDNATATNAK